MLKANGLHLVQRRSEVAWQGEFGEGGYEAFVQAVDRLIPQDGLVVAFLHYKILIGKKQGGKFLFYSGETFHPRHLMQLRVFHEQGELLVWRQDGVLKGRLRLDDQGEETDMVIAEPILLGTHNLDLAEGWTRLTEDRGVDLVLPLSNIRVDDKKRLRLVTHNYIGYNPLGQAGYVDCRFVAMKGGE